MIVLMLAHISHHMKPYMSADGSIGQTAPLLGALALQLLDDAYVELMFLTLAVPKTRGCGNKRGVFTLYI